MTKYNFYIILMIISVMILVIFGLIIILILKIITQKTAETEEILFSNLNNNNFMREDNFNFFILETGEITIYGLLVSNAEPERAYYEILNSDGALKHYGSVYLDPRTSTQKAEIYTGMFKTKGHYTLKIKTREFLIRDIIVS